MKRFWAMLLAMTMMGTTVYAADTAGKGVMAKPVLQKVQIDREEVTMHGYCIDGYTYFRLRDVAQEMTKNSFFVQAATETAKEKVRNGEFSYPLYFFDVDFNETENTIALTSETEYTAREQGEPLFFPSLQEEKEALPSEAEIWVDGKPYDGVLQGYVIEGYTYYKLRDLGEAMHFPVDWCEDERVIEIATMEMAARKPVIYLYPEETTEISVELEYDGVLTTTYPAYHNGWKVTAQPDGTLTNHADGREYSYLFWEGEGYGEPDFSEGFVVKGEDTVSFLQETLAAMGMMPKEYNEFIVYWLPYLQNNAYNLISFQWENYEEAAKLHITPKPDNLLRVFMAFKALDEPMDLPEQKLPVLQREGFTVVEWGGTEVY